ncbi:hypothetical protein E2C01_041940 [Portunus trituberculatus]|uniref:Uncharacterized protein n=1 Tax=Portunus trituberculatus TaxID=210409 RepID=A0A5B7FNU7_PORTR|nr:hypothetical protein [Portunus trituberculatus]
MNFKKLHLLKRMEKRHKVNFQERQDVVITCLAALPPNRRHAAVCNTVGDAQFTSVPFPSVDLNHNSYDEFT